jgi:NAD(P)-dependent dehydrogenase (short-subunit alcohol dehydrogenase family)
MEDKKIAFVSGANRGLGFEFSKQLTDRGWTVIAGYRSEETSRQLLELAGSSELLHAFRVDIADNKQVERLKKYLSENFGQLDLLVNNAAINPGEDASLSDVSSQDILQATSVNVIGVLDTTRQLIPLLRKGKNPRVVNVGSRAGLASHARNKTIPYGLSKSMLNMLTAQQAEAYRDDDIAVIVITPGWVRTDMGGSDADLSPEESIAGMLTVIDRVTLNDTGAFFDHKGERLTYD